MSVWGLLSILNINRGRFLDKLWGICDLVVKMRSSSSHYSLAVNIFIAASTNSICLTANVRIACDTWSSCFFPPFLVVTSHSSSLSSSLLMAFHVSYFLASYVIRWRLAPDVSRQTTTKAWLKCYAKCDSRYVQSLIFLLLTRKLCFRHEDYL